MAGQKKKWSGRTKGSWYIPVGEQRKKGEGGKLLWKDKSTEETENNENNRRMDGVKNVPDG